MRTHRWTTLAAVAGLTLTAVAAQAQAPARQVVRGVITDAQDKVLVIKGKDGKPVTVGLADGWTVAVMKPIAASEIKEGSFIGTAEMPQADGAGKSLEVHVFPPGVKMGEGHYNWDLKPGSMMTNGTVGKVVVAKGGREMDVVYSYGTRHIIVPPKVPIVQITGGDKAMIKKGVAVFIVAAQTPTGLISNSVSIGEKGKAPPM